MMAAVKSEFRKMLTLRSTYYIFGLAVLLAIFFAFYVEGFKTGAVDNVVNDPNKLAGEVISAISALITLMSIPGILLMTHEYRYNTITYTLTDSRSRSQVLLAKIITVSCFSVFFAVVFYCLAPSLAYLGVTLSGHHLVHQVFPAWELLWRAVVATWEYSMLALILAVIIRAQVGTFVALLLVPSMGESLLGLLLKKNIVYLPFNSIQSILMHNPLQPISYVRGALVALIYVVVAWVVAWWLFLRRDAN